MIDMLTQDYVVRVYEKQSNYFSTALFDYELPRKSKTNYIVFPSLFLDIIFYRDEITVKLIRMSHYSIILDATNSTLLREIINNQNVRRFASKFIERAVH